MRSLYGPCPTAVGAERGGGAAVRQVWRSGQVWREGGGVKGSSVIDHTPQHCNKQMRAINAKVINQTWSCTVLIGSLFPARVSRSRHITLTLSKTQQTDLTVCSLECTAPNWTSLSGTPLVVHQPHRQRQKKNSTSSHLSTPGVDTHTRGLLKYSDRES